MYTISQIENKNVYFKTLIVADSHTDRIGYFRIDVMGCGDGFLVKSCNILFKDQNVECIDNSIYDSLEKECHCKIGYYLKTTTNGNSVIPECIKCPTFCSSCYGPNPDQCADRSYSR